ncbi:MAG TPA: ATP-binding protein [Thermohalobaculum sp.]|nr:ATP-binding protein [Thermohalobaculum sp.]
MAVVTTVRLERDGDVSHARRAARTAVAAAGGSLNDQTRFATAVSEIARNALQYGRDGEVELAVRAAGRRTALIATVRDTGPGIGEIDAVLRGTYTSAHGLGLGIRGARRITDRFDLATGAGGTRVELGVLFDGTEEPAALARRIADALGEAARRNPIDELTEQNRALRDALARQAFLQRELHHRTKNNLAIIHSYAAMQARQVESEEARQALAALAGRVHALGLVHSFLHHSDGIGEIELRAYLSELAGSLGSAFSDKSATIECDIEEISLDPDLAVEVGILVNELVTNAMKHATPPDGAPLVIRIEARRENDVLVLRVVDNGAEVDDPETMMTSRSLGWRVIRAAAQKLGGSIAIDDAGGLAVTVTCPIQGGRHDRGTPSGASPRS